MQQLEDNKIQIIDTYNNGVSLSQLAKDWKVSREPIRKLLIKNGVKIRTSADLKTKFDETFFLSQTPEAYYFWGFMLGDGSLQSKNNHKKNGYKYISITLKETDEVILQNFCKWLKLDVNYIKHGTNNHQTKYARLELFGSVFQENDFSNYGIVVNKTYNPVVPKIPDEFIVPFIMGLIDADGSIAWKKPQKSGRAPVPDHLLKRKRRKGNYIRHENSLQLVGHPLIMNWVIDQLRKLGFDGNINFQIVKGKGKKDKLGQRKECEWKRIRIQRKNDILILARLLDISKFDFVLERKWSGLKQAISQSPNSL